VKSLAFLFIVIALGAPTLRAQETYGTIRATTRIHEDGTLSTTIVDPEKHTAEETWTDAGKPPKVLKKTTYLLGDGDLAVGAIFYDAKSKIIYKASYTRDPAGHVTEAVFSSPDDQYLGKRVFVYGAGNTATQVIDYDARGQVITPAQPVARPGKSSKKSH